MQTIPSLKLSPHTLGPQLSIPQRGKAKEKERELERVEREKEVPHSTRASVAYSRITLAQTARSHRFSVGTAGQITILPSASIRQLRVVPAAIHCQTVPKLSYAVNVGITGTINQLPTACNHNFSTTRETAVALGRRANTTRRQYSRISRHNLTVLSPFPIFHSQQVSPPYLRHLLRWEARVSQAPTDPRDHRQYSNGIQECT